jgi:hypothetical protein
MAIYHLTTTTPGAPSQFDADDDGTAIAFAMSVVSPLGHALSRDGRFLAWIDPTPESVAEEPLANSP